MLFFSASFITNSSFREPPGCIIPEILFFEHNLTISGKGKKPSDANMAPVLEKFSEILEKEMELTK